ncbi:MAG TPA: TonB family protein [Thermoanaerobaculia bacterium]|jgi:TonB family protein|nr:TonB family protein [Thermoanaerobaculia bacterium]
MSSAQPQNILVVEYEPRWADRVRDALVGLPLVTLFAKDGEEAMRIVNAHDLKLIILSSVVPKISAPDVIRAIRGRPHMQRTPILMTVSGYKGSSPKQDAMRMGATDILAKPYTEEDLMEKVQQMLGIGQLTSTEIFGDLLKDEARVAAPLAATAAAPAPPPKKPAASKDNVDKMLEQTLASVMTKKRDPSKPKTSPGTSELDKRYQDTLSGLEKSVHARRTSPGSVPSQRATLSDKVPIVQPVFPPAPAPVAVTEEEPTDGTRFGQYVLLDKIASGGMAEVWKARMRGVEGFQKIVAIKKILPHLSDNQEFIEMFVDEAKLAAQLNHNNIIHIYDLGKISNSYYIAMEYVDGHDLKAILKRAQERDQPMMVEVALFIASKLAAALDYAHRKRDFDEKEMGLVHRDVSPQNVLISHEGDIKLCDFGIAKAASKASHTQVGALKGKLQYMSPEQASGKTIDRRSDIFALATVLFEMLTARKLFTGESEMSILEQVREARVTPPSQINEEVTPEIDRVVLKALQKDPAARYQTAGEMARDLDAILYNFKPTPTSADLAIYMHHLWIEEPVKPKIEEPEPVAEVDEAPDLAVAAAAVPPPAPKRPTTAPGNVAMPAWEARPSDVKERKRSPVVPLAVAAVLVAGIVGAFFYVRSRGPAPVTSAPVSQSSPNAPAPAPVPASDSVAPMTQTTATTAPAPPVLDPNAIDQEVQRRLAAERARLEQQSQPQPATTPATSTRPAPILQLQRPPQVTQTVAPAPVQVTETQAPVPAPATPATTTQAAVTQTQPPPAAEPAAAPSRVREGDLVPAGAEGLVPPRIIRRGSVPYPPLAKAQRVQGTVLLSVLVSETGQVLEVRVLRGVSQAVGLNEAAERIMRTSTFTPGTIDGVRVKSWTTVPVDFKL